MKVLILHQHFKVPQFGGAIRSYYLAKALVEKGAQVVVVTAHNAPGYRQESADGIEVHYLPVSYDNRFGFLKRVFSFYRFVVKAVRCSANHRDADICYAISTPLTTGAAAMILRRKHRLPYIFEVGDLWPDAPIDMGFIGNPVLKRFLYAMEKRIYRHAEAIVALSTSIHEAVSKKMPGKKVHLIPNMADTDFFKPEGKRLALEEKFQVTGKFVVSYIGALGVANGLDCFLECAKASGAANLPIRFLICGDGAMLPMLKRSAMQAGLANLTFIPFQNRNGVAEIMNVTDATFTCYQPFTILETGSPNKYFDGLAAGKLTIINFRGWIKEEIERASCGIYVNPRQPEEFVKHIRPFVDDPLLLKKYQQRGRELAERKYSRKLLSDKFSEIVNYTCSQAGGDARPQGDFQMF